MSAGVTPGRGGGDMAGCVFCRIVAGRAPATVLRAWPGAIAIVPLNPVAPGHVLVIPRTHVADVGVDPAVSQVAMAAAAELAGELADCNVITSRGAVATQTVFHLHLHVVPRTAGDGLSLPWTSQPEPPATGAGREVINRGRFAVV